MFKLKFAITRPTGMDLAADRVVQFLTSTQGFQAFMRERAVDLVRVQRELIDARTLKPLSKSRIAQRVRNHVPFGPDHPLKATGQLYDSLKGEAQRINKGAIAAVAYARKTNRVPEEKVGDRAVASGLDSEGSFLEAQFRRERGKRRERLRRRRRKRLGGAATRITSSGPSNAELVAIHKAKGRDITNIPAEWARHSLQLFQSALRAVIARGVTAGSFSKVRKPTP